MVKPKKNTFKKPVEIDFEDDDFTAVENTVELSNNAENEIDFGEEVIERITKSKTTAKRNKTNGDAKANTLKPTKKRTTRKRKSKKKNYFAIFQSQRFKLIFGATTLFFAAYLFIAFISYCYTWKIDQDKIFHLAWRDILSINLELQNALGRFGGMIAHQFIYKWFGLASFLFPTALLLAGLRIFISNLQFDFSKVIRYFSFFLVWSSVFLSFFYYDEAFSYGGVFGDNIYKWVYGFLGYTGTISTLILALLVVLFLTYEFEVRIPKMKKLQFETPNINLPKFNFGFNFFKKKKRKDFVDYEDYESKTKEVETLKPTFSKKTKEVKVEESTENEVNFDDNLEFNVTQTKPTKVTVNPFKKLEIEVNNEEDGKAHIEQNYDYERVANLKEHQEAVDRTVGKTATDKEGTHFTVDTLYDPTLELKDYQYPSVDFLEDYGDTKITIDKEKLNEYKDQIIETLLNYKIQITKIKATVGPTITLYEIVPAPGVKISKIKNLEDDIALSLAALGIRIIAPMPGKGTIGIEVPNLKKQIVSMKTVLASEKFQSCKMELPIALGKTISNEVFITDLAKLPHLLIAGATGQGKSVGLNAILVSLLYKKHPSQLKFVLIDPKKVELSLFNLIENHFLASLPGEEEAIITDTKKVIVTLAALCQEMDERYDLLKKAQVKKLTEYNEKFVARKLNPNNGHKYMPYIVLVIDEFADLMMVAGKEVELPIARLAQLARAVGIHLIIATQRPSVNIITGTIKANFPGRIAFRVTSKIDSRTILDTGGADQLVGMGDMLLSINNVITRLQCAFVDTPEVEKIAEFIGGQKGYPGPFQLPEFLTDEEAAERGEIRLKDRDENFEDAARLIVTHQQGSTSLIQRKMSLGYNRAGRIMDQLEMCSIVGPPRGSKAREVYMTDLTELENFLSTLK